MNLISSFILFLDFFPHNYDLIKVEGGGIWFYACGRSKDVL